MKTQKRAHQSWGAWEHGRGAWHVLNPTPPDAGVRGAPRGQWTQLFALQVGKLRQGVLPRVHSQAELRPGPGPGPRPQTQQLRSRWVTRHARCLPQRAPQGVPADSPPLSARARPSPRAHACLHRLLKVLCVCSGPNGSLSGDKTVLTALPPGTAAVPGGLHPLFSIGHHSGCLLACATVP